MNKETNKEANIVSQETESSIRMINLPIKDVYEKVYLNIQDGRSIRQSKVNHQIKTWIKEQKIDTFAMTVKLVPYAGNRYLCVDGNHTLYALESLRRSKMKGVETIVIPSTIPVTINTNPGNIAEHVRNMSTRTQMDPNRMLTLTSKGIENIHKYFKEVGSIFVLWDGVGPCNKRMVKPTIAMKAAMDFCGVHRDSTTTIDTAKKLESYLILNPGSLNCLIEAMRETVRLFNLLPAPSQRNTPNAPVLIYSNQTWRAMVLFTYGMGQISGGYSDISFTKSGLKEITEELGSGCARMQIGEILKLIQEIWNVRRIAEKRKYPILYLATHYQREFSTVDIRTFTTGTIQEEYQDAEVNEHGNYESEQ